MPGVMTIIIVRIPVREESFTIPKMSTRRYSRWQKNAGLSWLKS